MPRRPDPSWADPPGSPVLPPARAGPPAPLLHVVLHEPEIPNNTGNIGRTCVAVGAALHLIHPLGFDLSAKARRRAGLDYWPRLECAEHADWAAYRIAAAPARMWFFTTRAARPYFQARFRPGDHLVFGKETAGLPQSILAEAGDAALAIPMLPGERSLNLATAVCAAVYEAVRQFVDRGEMALDATGRLVPAAFGISTVSAGKIRANRGAPDP